ncbi:MAG: lipid II flippase MurJ [Longimicrobiales bacterium]
MAQPTSPLDGEQPTGPSERLGRFAHGFKRLFAGSLFGKCLGIVRELALAANFGTGTWAGSLRAGRAAMVLPTSGFGASIIEPGFIPLYTRCLRDDPDRTGGLFWSTLTLTALFTGAIAAVLWFGASFWAAVVAPGFGPEARAATAGMIRVMSLGVPVLALARILSGLEMAHGGYFVQSLRSTAENLGVLTAIGAAVLWRDPWLLGWGLVVYAVLYLVIATAAVWKGRMVPAFHGVTWHDFKSHGSQLTGLARLLWILPLAAQGTVVAERVVASLISVDAVAALGYAKAVSETGMALVAIPLGLVGLAELSRVDLSEARERLAALVPVLLVGLVPCSLFLTLNASNIVDLLFARGQFGAQSTHITAMILIGLGIGLWAQVTSHVLIKGLNAAGHNKEAVRATVAAAIAHLVVTLLLYRPLGALALGFGATAFELVRLWFGAHHFRLFGVLGRYLAPLSIGGLLYTLLAVRTGGEGAADLVPAGLVFLTFWALYIMVVPQLRAVVTPILVRPFLTRRAA